MTGQATRCLLSLVAVCGVLLAADGRSPPAAKSPAEQKSAHPKPPDQKEPEAKPADPEPAESPPPELAPTIKLRGRIEVDAVMAAQPTASQVLIGDLQNGYGFRRARLGAEGTLGAAADYVSEVDFAGGDIRLRDMFIGLNVVPWVRLVRVGYSREPFSLEGATSSRYITFLERSPLSQLDPARNWGVVGHWQPESERVLLAVGAFRDGTDGSGFSTGDEDAWAVTARLTGLPVYETGDHPRLLHVGGAFSHRSPAGGVVQYDQGPRSNLLVLPDNPASPLLPRVNIPATGQQLYNLQAAWLDGPVSVQGEWYATTIPRQAGGVAFLHGFYTFVAFFLTGEHRGYDRQRASFDRVRVRRPVTRSAVGDVCGVGAVELVARFSLSDFAARDLSNGPTAGQPGTILYETTIGVNWYLNDFTRLMVNYNLSVPAIQGQAALPVHVFGLRTAVYW